MHSLRAILLAAGVQAPPFSLRTTAQKLGVSEPVTILRTTRRLRFPENDIELFQTFQLTSDFVRDVVAGIPNKKIVLANVSANDEAKRLLEDRIALRDFLLPLAGDPANEDQPALADAVKNQTTVIRDLLTSRQAEAAQVQIEKLLPFADFRLIRVDDPIWSNALRTDEVQAFRPAPPGGIFPIKIPGYEGPNVKASDRRRIFEVALFLQPNSSDRRFRQHLLKALSLTGQRKFREAMAEYDRILGPGGPGLNVGERQFAALLKGTAQNAQADREFNRLRPNDPEARAAVRASYSATAGILAANDVNGENPIAQVLTTYAVNQIVLLDLGFNALGSPVALRPSLGRSALDLRNEAAERLAQADVALAKFQEFTEKLETTTDDQVRISIDLGAANSAIDQMAGEAAILELRRQQLQLQRNRVGALFGLQLITSVASIIVSIAGGEGGGGGTGGGSTGGGTSSHVEGAGRLIDLGFQQAILAKDENILALEMEGLAARRRQVDRQKTFLDSLAGTAAVSRAKYLELSNSFEEFSLEAMRGTVRKAFQANVQLAFERGTSASPVNIDASILDYSNDPELFEMAERFRQQQLNPLTDAIAQPVQKDSVPLVIFLSLHDPLALARFQQTGETDFVISLYDVDRRLPGSPNVRIVDISIRPFDGAPAGGVTVTLTHNGVFMVRDDATLTEASRLFPGADALVQAETAFREGRNLTFDGVTFVNAGENRRRFRVGGPATQPTTGRQGLDEYGMTGLWNIKINENELDQIELNKIMEVEITFHVEAGEAEAPFETHINRLLRDYEGEQEQQQGDVLDKVTFFSMRDRFRDELNEVIDGSAPEGVALNIDSVLGEDSKTLLKAVVLQFTGPAAKGIPGIGLTATSSNSSKAFALTTETGGFTEDLSKEIPIIPRPERFPVGGTWTLQVPGAETFGIVDIRWFVVHEARKPV